MDEETTVPLQPVEDANASACLEQLIDLLEKDRLGYRLERFVAAERERFVEALTTEEFGTSANTAPKTWAEMFDRVQVYDALVLPYVEFFAVGCAYSGLESAPIWTDFLERIATCNYKTNGSYNQATRNLTLYPSLLLVYGAGVYAAIRQRWVIMNALLSHSFPLDYGEAQSFVSRTSSFDIIPEGGQKAIPGREREHTPLLNHMFDELYHALGHYTLSKTYYTEAFAYFEIVLAAAFAYAEERETVSRGQQVTDEIWTPPGRYWWQEGRRGTAFDILSREVTAKASAWPPVAAGFYGGKAEAFVSLLPKIKSIISKRGFW